MTDTLRIDHGPRHRRRLRYIDATVWTLVAGGLVLGAVQLARAGELAAAKWEPLTDPAIQKFLWGGLVGTVTAGATAIALAIPVGLVLAAGRLSPRRPIAAVAGAVTEVCRALPILFVVYFLLMVAPLWGLRVPPFWQIVVAIALHGAGALAEIFRAGMLALPKGQAEAAASLGLSRVQALRAVILPQVFRALLPAVISQSVAMLKETSLGYVVSYPELLRRGQLLADHLGDGYLQAYAVVAAVFITLNVALSALAVHLERRLSTTRVRAPAPGLASPPAPRQADRDDQEVGVSGSRRRDLG
ncbi:amino acid ABC transporter permease [Cryptosporangium aurantiacum]|uniref:Glutamate transport system permease protein n=1 Tax=Cryptosporangium aurantiacum TaxID=134849 RepID=A0A1M7RJK2_9ACTN|nr:amino acid ABC transporter permease [Cryptosporangium aurantiacum]SHN46326.1 glutamate transport system permease protein [Cryptosporangium aurantiacum]